MMAPVLQRRRSAATTLLLAVSTHRSSLLLLPSSSTLASLAIVASHSPFTASAFAQPPLLPASLIRYQTTSLADTDSSCAATSSTSDENNSDDAIIMADDPGTGYLNAKDAAALDVDLMSTPGFSVDQLMELAGLSVAEAVYDVAVAAPDNNDGGGENKKRVLLVCGPGNNGGDGLVAARHLVHFGLESTVVYPKRSTKPLFVNLVKQCEDMGIAILDEMPASSSDDHDSNRFDVIVDAIFGFSFRGTAPREPFATAISKMVEMQKRQESTVVISVDVPSGWDVDGGDLTGTGFRPDALISLTAPKLSSKKFTGRHFIGGRFLPPAIAEKYGIRMPPYPGKSQVLEII